MHEMHEGKAESSDGGRQWYRNGGGGGGDVDVDGDGAYRTDESNQGPAERS